MDSWVEIFSTINLAGAIHALIQALLLCWLKGATGGPIESWPPCCRFLPWEWPTAFADTIGLYERWSFLAILMGPVILASGPLFHIYVKAMARKAFRFDPDYRVFRWIDEFKF